MRTAARWILNRTVEVKRDGETSANTGGSVCSCYADLIRLLNITFS